MKSAFLPFLLVLTAQSLSFGATATTDKSEPTGRIQASPEAIALINGEPVYNEDLERVLGDMHTGADQGQRRSIDIDRLMFRLVNDALLAQEARYLGFHEEPPLPEQLQRRRLVLAVEQLERTEIRGRAEPTDEEVRKAFESGYSTAVFHIITVYERADAAAVLERLQEGADFEATARGTSVDQYSARGGVVESIDRFNLSREVAEVLFQLRPGQVAGPIRTGLGWSIVRLDSQAPADPERFLDRQAFVRRVQRMRSEEKLRDELAGNLRDSHTVEVHWPMVNAVGCEQLPDGRLQPVVDDPSAVVANVDEIPITMAAFLAALRDGWNGIRNTETALAARPVVLDRLIRKALWEAEAVKRGFDKTPSVDRAVAALERQRIAKRYLTEVVAKGITIDEEEIKEFYEQNLESFRKPPRFRAGQITVESSEAAERLVEQLRQGADLAWLARQHSTDSFKKAGGDRGWLEPTSPLNSLIQGLPDAEPGDVLGPYDQEESWVVLKIVDRQEQGIYTLDEVSGRIHSALYSQKFGEKLEQQIDTLRARSEISINDEVLARLQISGEQAAQKEHSFGDSHR